jgi:hypothetical protein
MSDDLVNQLREMAARTHDINDHTTLHLSADEIERLRADNKRLTDKLMKIAEKETYT